MLKIIRIVAVLVGLGTVLWQVMQWQSGNWQNMFFWPDIIVGLFLGFAAFVKVERWASILMLVGFAGMAGIYSVATLGTLTMGAYDFGAFTTTVGLVFCLPAIWVLVRRLV